MQIGYLDPASGSILASALVGGAAAFGVAAKSARGRITGVFKKKPADTPDADTTEVTTEVAPGEDVTAESEA